MTCGRVIYFFSRSLFRNQFLRTLHEFGWKKKSIFLRNTTSKKGNSFDFPPPFFTYVLSYHFEKNDAWVARNTWLPAVDEAVGLGWLFLMVFLNWMSGFFPQFHNKTLHLNIIYTNKNVRRKDGKKVELREGNLIFFLRQVGRIKKEGRGREEKKS